MDLKTFFDAVGGDYEAVLARLGRDAMILKFVRKFPAEPSFSALQNAVEAKDAHAAFLAAHTLKGVAANLGFGALEAAADALTEALRDASCLPSDRYFDAVEAAWKSTVSHIAQLDSV